MAVRLKQTRIDVIVLKNAFSFPSFDKSDLFSATITSLDEHYEKARPFCKLNIWNLI